MLLPFKKIRFIIQLFVTSWNLVEDYTVFYGPDVPALFIYSGHIWSAERTSAAQSLGSG